MPFGRAREERGQAVTRGTPILSGQLVNTSLAFFFLAVGLRNYLIGRLSSQSFLKLHP